MSVGSAGRKNGKCFHVLVNISELPDVSKHYLGQAGLGEDGVHLPRCHDSLPFADKLVKQVLELGHGL